MVHHLIQKTTKFWAEKSIALLLSLLVLLSLSSCSLKQANSKDEKVYTVVKENAHFNGGERARMEFMAKYIKYPQEAIQQNLEGSVYVGFNVNRNGRLSDIKVVRGIHPSLDKEAIRIVKKMPKWIPAINFDGKVVKQAMVTKVTFRLMTPPKPKVGKQ